LGDPRWKIPLFPPLGKKGDFTAFQQNKLLNYSKEGSDSTEERPKRTLASFPTYLAFQETELIDEGCPPS
jgi:hypothetical protein